MEPLIIFICIFFFIVGIQSYNEIQEMEKKNRNKKAPLDDFLGSTHNEPITLADLNLGSMYMSAADKAEYLHSTKWQKLRKVVFERDSNCCVTCGIDYNLSCHHITYEYLGDERIEDLATLCRPCHSALHKRLGYDRETKYYPKPYKNKIKRKHL